MYLFNSMCFSISSRKRPCLVTSILTDNFFILLQDEKWHNIISNRLLSLDINTIFFPRTISDCSFFEQNIHYQFPQHRAGYHLVFPDDGASQKGRPRRAAMGPHRPVRATPWLSRLVGRGLTAPHCRLSFACFIYPRT
jgi:hypothetical protein